MHSEPSPFFILWILTTQGVNLAFYLALTRVAYGWARTLGAYFVYFAALAVVFPRSPFVHGGEDGAAGMLSVSFICFFCLWTVLSLVMSRGAFGRRFFATILCGIHQLIAFSVSLLLMRHLKSENVGTLLATGLMALMGWFLIARIRPRIRKMPDNLGWAYLNVTAVALFVLLYSAGIWPVFVATGAPDHVLVFFIATVVAIVFFPMALAFSEKSRLVSTLAMVEDNLRTMAGEMTSRGEMIAAARQVRNDSRFRRATLAEMLRQGKVEEAIAFLEKHDDENTELKLAESVWCENETINAILSGYSRKAASAGLHFSAMASVSAQCNLPEVELVEMVSNLLEVAIGAADVKGEVTCLLRQRTGSFGVTVTNTVSPDFRLNADDLPVIRPNDSLASVSRLTRKYKGEYHYQVADGILTCDVLLSVEEQ